MVKKKFSKSILLFFTLVILVKAVYSQTNKILTPIDTTKVKITGLPCPNSSTKVGGPWSYEEAEKRKVEIYDMQLSIKFKDWKNPTTGGAIHVNKNDEIEVYQFWLGIYQGRNDTAVFYTGIAKDTAVILRNTDTLWNYVQGIGFGNETSVLITSEYELAKSKSFKKIMDELWQPGVQLYYLKAKQSNRSQKFK